MNKEKLNRIGEKFYIKGLEESQEIQKETCTDCGDGCEKCQTAKDEQDKIEAREEVEEANKEAAGIIKNDSHRMANERALAATKKACEESIGDGAEDDTVRYPDTPME